MPSTRLEFWRKKLLGNREKDLSNITALRQMGWRILVIWECSFRGAGKKRGKEINTVVSKAVKWLSSDKKYSEIIG